MYEDILVSVVMPVHNTKEDYLRPAIDSILNQTHNNLEVIIVDDYSDKICCEILGEYADRDSRIRIIRNRENLGITKSLNRGIDECHGQYVARMDADDISLPHRIERQVEYLENHSDIDVLACGANVYIEGDEVYRGNIYHVDPNRLRHQFPGIYRKFSTAKERVHLSYGNIEFTHPTVVYRKSFLDRYNIWYDESLPKAQDYGMWVTCSKITQMDCLQECLFISRVNSDMSGVKASKQQIECSKVTKCSCLGALIEDASDTEKDIYSHFRDMELYGTVSENVALIDKLVNANSDKQVYPVSIYEKEISFWWYRKGHYTCNKCAKQEMLGATVVRRLLRKYLFLSLVDYALDQIYARYVSYEWYYRLSKELTDI